MWDPSDIHLVCSQVILLSQEGSVNEDTSLRFVASYITYAYAPGILRSDGHGQRVNDRSGKCSQKCVAIVMIHIINAKPTWSVSFPMESIASATPRDRMRSKKHVMCSQQLSTAHCMFLWAHMV